MGLIFSAHEKNADAWNLRLLRRGKRAKREEHSAKSERKHFTSTYTWIHLITLSALASTLGGIVRPICLAVFRLITSSNFVGCSMGRSAGLAPFRILSTYVAARRKLSASSVAYDERHPLST